MLTDDRCDVAIWDVGGALTGDVRARFKRRVRRDGPKLAVETGDWLNRRVAVGWPQRVVAAQSPRLAEALVALVQSHQPRWTLIVGPAAGVADRASVRDVVLASEVISGDQVFKVAGAAPQVLQESRGLAWGGLGDRALQSNDASAGMTTDWAAAAGWAASELGVEFVLLGVATTVSTASVIAPPKSLPTTRARQAGALLGNLLKGRLGGVDSDNKCQQATTRAIEALLRLV